MLCRSTNRHSECTAKALRIRGEIRVADVLSSVEENSRRGETNLPPHWVNTAIIPNSQSDRRISRMFAATMNNFAVSCEDYLCSVKRQRMTSECLPIWIMQRNIQRQSHGTP